ncbi:MAG TPA: DUF5668 domain-containing protein, partial [Steroidobacter sp.]|nr:DUF5668 domain-containing protein [Steroidobacter sp.]
MSSDPSPVRGPQDGRRPELFSYRFIVGVIIIALGALLLADNLDLINSKYVIRALWPLLLIAVGVGMVRGPDLRRRRAWGWVLITFGAWIFLDRIGWVHVSLWHVLFPGLLLFVGGSLVWRAVSGPTIEPPAGPEHSEFVRSFAFMSACELRPVSRPFRGADLSALMGGLKLDLTGARMEGDCAMIDVFAFWGGVEIHVPPDWTVTSKFTTLLGGYIDKRRPTSVVPV